MKPFVKDIFYYPVKGLAGIPLDSVDVGPKGLPHDRALGFVFEDSIPPEKNLNGIENLMWIPKTKMAVQMEWPGLAALKINLDTAGELTLTGPQNKSTKGNVHRLEDRKKISGFMSDYLKTLTPAPGAKRTHATPVVLAGQLHSSTRFPDREKEHISFLNLATLREIEKSFNLSIDIQRFRGNILVEGMEPWSEYTWVGKKIKVGDCEIEITAPIVRCFNVNVNPTTGSTDMNLLPLLKPLCDEKIQKNFAIFGVLGRIAQPGRVSLKSELQH
ncbi:MAG: MOSC domain-containing protein [Bdellovibrionales bacterium]